MYEIELHTDYCGMIIMVEVDGYQEFKDEATNYFDFNYHITRVTINGVEVSKKVIEQNEELNIELDNRVYEEAQK